MADNTDWFADVQAVLDGDAADPVEESAPLLDTTPSATEAITAVATPPEGPVSVVEESTEPAPVVAESTPEPESKPVVWDSPDNPHYEASRKLQQLQSLAQQAQQQAAIKAEQERIRALADDDPQRVTELQNFITQNQQPLVAQIQTKEQEVELAAKWATVYDEAIKFVLTPDQQKTVLSEVERMMALPGGPEHLHHDIATRKQERSSYETELNRLRAENESLKRGSAVQAQVADRLERRADLVESGSGTGASLETRWNDASSFDQAFDVIRDLIPQAG